MFNPSESVDEHLNKIEARLQKPVSNGQIALSGLNGALDVVVGTGVAGIAWGAGRRVKQLPEKYKELVSQKLKHTEADIKITVNNKEAFNWKGLAEEGWQGAKEHPKTALTILGVTTAIGLADGIYTYMRFKDANNQEVGERVREIRKRSTELSPEKLREASTRILGRDVMVEKIAAKGAETQQGAAIS